MKKQMIGVVGMMLAASQSTELQESYPVTSRVPKPKPLPKLTPEQQLERIREKRSLLDRRIQAYSDKRSKGILFEIQGFEIKAINRKNAIRGLRKCLGETGFRTELTKQEIDENIQTIATKIEGTKAESVSEKVSD